VDRHLLLLNSISFFGLFCVSDWLIKMAYIRSEDTFQKMTEVLFYYMDDTVEGAQILPRDVCAKQIKYYFSQSKIPHWARWYFPLLHSTLCCSLVIFP
jgi:hypothetical protein